jgi:hypothetical protein
MMALVPPRSGSSLAHRARCRSRRRLPGDRRRTRPGSLSAWIIAEHRQLVHEHADDASTSELSGKMAEVLTQIARHHLRIDTLEDAGWDSADIHDVSTAGLRDALRAAYLDGACRPRRRAEQRGWPGRPTASARPANRERQGPTASASRAANKRR